MVELTAARLRELLHYEPEAGLFHWLVTANTNSAKPGTVAGCVKGAGYVYIQISGRSYCAHRLAVLYMTGALPPEEVDHVNGVRTDNRWENLRPVTASGNRMNQRKARSDNKCGFLGVTAVSPGRWTASITVQGRNRHIGTYKSPEEAHAAYVTAKRELHSTCAI